MLKVVLYWSKCYSGLKMNNGMAGIDDPKSKLSTYCVNCVLSSIPAYVLPIINCSISLLVDVGIKSHTGCTTISTQTY